MLNPGLYVSVTESPPANEPARSRTSQRGFADGIDDCMDAGGRATQGAVAEVRAAGPGWPVCGFTLVELVVIIVVMAILAVIAIPRMIDFTTFGEVGFHDSVKASVQYARKLAVGSRRYVCVNVTLGTAAAGRVAIRQVTAVPETPGNINCAAATPVSLPAASNVATCLAHEVCAPDGVTLAGGASFIYDPLGRPVDVDRTVLGSVASLTVTNQPPISIQANTGLVD